MWGSLVLPLNGYWDPLTGVERLQLHINSPPLHSVEVKAVCNCIYAVPLGPHGVQGYDFNLRDVFPGVKRPGRDAYSSHTSTDNVKNEWSFASTSPNFVIKLFYFGM